MKLDWKTLFGTRQKQDISTIFDDIVGHDDAKSILTWAIQSDKPVHVLLKGPFGIAKTELTKRVMAYVGEKNSHWAIGSRTSKSGLSDLFITNPNIEYLFIDEFESLPKKDQYVLLSAMEDGVVSETLYGKTKGRKVKVNVRVIATSNEIRKIDRALLTRFSVVNMKGYSEKEFVRVALHKAQTEGIEQRTIEFIAVGVYNNFHEPNVRDVIKIARLTKGDLDKIITAITVMGIKRQ